MAIVTLPTFLVIGAEKAGTTALHAALDRHPRVFMSNPKEPSFFLSEDSRYLEQDLMGQPHGDIRTLAEYEALFAAAAPGQAIGESSPCYLYSPDAARFIKSLIPDVRIVVMLRDPAERAFSQFTFNQQRGWEPLSRTFQEALALEDERVRANSMWAFHYVNRGMYARQLAPYVETFGDQLRAWAYDEFVKDPAKVLGEIHDFLGVERVDLEEPAQRKNVTSLPRLGIIRQLLDRPNPVKALVGRLIPTHFRRAMGARLRQWNSRRPERDDSSIASLRPRFVDDIEALASGLLPGARRWLERD